jgi:hypothetical protein
MLTTLLRKLTLVTLATVGLSIVMLKASVPTQAQSSEEAQCETILENLSDEDDLDDYTDRQLYCLIVYGELNDVTDGEDEPEDLVEAIENALNDEGDAEDDDRYDTYITEEELESEGLDDATLRALIEDAVKRADVEALNSTPNLLGALGKAIEKPFQSSPWVKGYNRLTQSKDGKAQGKAAKQETAKAILNQRSTKI